LEILNRRRPIRKVQTSNENVIIDRVFGDGLLSLIEWSRERLANYKVPRKVVVAKSLPTNATGKVQKFKLPT